MEWNATSTTYTPSQTGIMAVYVMYTVPCAAQQNTKPKNYDRSVSLCVYACVSVLVSRSPLFPLAISFAHTLRSHRCLCVSVNRCALVVVLIAFLWCIQIDLISMVFVYLSERTPPP